MDHRYYDPARGRFTIPDSMNGFVTDPNSWNRYAYAGGDPVNKSDPPGTCYMWVTGDVGPGNLCLNVGGGGHNGPHPFVGADGSGNGAGSKDFITKPSYPPVHMASKNYAPAMVAMVQAGFDNALNILADNSQCASLFEPNPGFLGAQANAESVLAGTTYTLFDVGDILGNMGITQSSTKVILNTNAVNPFFSQPGADGKVAFAIPSPTTPGAGITLSLSPSDTGAFILLHELGHQTGVLGPDSNDQVNGANSAQVLNNCFGMNIPLQ